MEMEPPRPHPHTAHIPGAVEGETCADCHHLDPCSNKRKGRCKLSFQFRGMLYRFDRDEAGDRAVNWWRGLPTIRADMPACKYFAAKPG